MLVLEPNVDLPLFVLQRGTRRYSVEEYHRLRDEGFLDGETRYELLDGYITPQMVPKPAHTSTTRKLRNLLQKMPILGFEVMTESPLTLPSDSESVPDLVVVRLETEEEYDARNPGPEDCELVVEVAKSSLQSDRTDMLAIYARDRVKAYWIVNLKDRQVEVHQVPNGTKAKPKYKTMKVFKEGQKVPVVLGGVKRGEIAVDDILPKAG